MRIQIDRPTKSVNSEIFFRESGYMLTCIGDEFFLTGEATEAELLAAYAAHTVKVPTPAEKLFNATGLTVEEYKALGL